MQVVAQGTAGAGKTTSLQSLEMSLGQNATYIPECVLPMDGTEGDDYFFANDQAKRQTAEAADTSPHNTALIDRDELSTLAWIGARDGNRSLSYKTAYERHLELTGSNQTIAPDAFLRFDVPFSVSAERQNSTNHPLLRNEQFAGYFKSLLHELVAEFVTEDKLAVIDGCLPLSEMLEQCNEHIESRRKSLTDAVNVGNEISSPYINFAASSFNTDSVSNTDGPLACVVLKPDCISRGLTSTVIESVEALGATILARKTKVLDDHEVMQLWPRFFTESWWKQTSEYMRSGLSIGLLCSLGELGILGYDQLTATKRILRTEYKDPNELRKPVSLVHTSDSAEETMRNVLAFWTPNELQNIVGRRTI